MQPAVEGSEGLTTKATPEMRIAQGPLSVRFLLWQVQHPLPVPPMLVRFSIFLEPLRRSHVSSLIYLMAR